ncbi:MAG: lysophospholipid acyltransferase family protein [Betaproteobacteria bacterium]
MTWLFRLLGRLPLPLNHAVGAMAGWLAWWASARHRRLTRENIIFYAKHSGLDDVQPLINAAVTEQGKGISEMAVAWTAQLDKLYELVRSCTGWEHVEAAKASQRAIIFVTPHLGCYDIAGRYLESRIPVTALYRPPKQKWLEPVMQQGRKRGEGSTASADASGIRVLLKTLKSRGNIIILPDQVPAPEQGGDGVWADFFGRPAYTMTLLPRLAKSANATVLFFFAERLPHGRGYHVHIEPMSEPFSEDRQIAARQTNAMVERLIAMAPAQYLWGYNRYKHPAGAPLPPSAA